MNGMGKKPIMLEYSSASMSRCCCSTGWQACEYECVSVCVGLYACVEGTSNVSLERERQMVCHGEQHGKTNCFACHTTTTISLARS